MNKAQLDHFVLVSDGGCRGNGTSSAQCYGNYAVIAVGSDGAEELGYVAPIHEYTTLHTNNEAEYQAMSDGLVYMKSLLIRMKASPKSMMILVATDSQLLVSQLNGEAKVKAANLQILHQDVKNMMTYLGAEVVKVDRSRVVKILGH